MGTQALEQFAAEITRISTMSDSEQADAMKKAIVTLPKAQQDALIQALKPPDSRTNNAIWLIIISTFAIVMLLSVTVLSISVFREPITTGTKPETVLTVFMTVTAFLAGLFAPSPAPRKG